MKINLWKPGEERYRVVEVNKGDLILLKNWNADIIGGKVLEITEEEEIKLLVDRVLTVTEKVYEENKEYFFDLTETYGIDIIMTADEVFNVRKSVNIPHLKEMLEEFNDNFNFLSQDRLTEEDFERMLTIYTESLENRKFYDNLFETTVKNTLYDILLELEEKYMKQDKKIDYGLFNNVKDVKG